MSMSEEKLNKYMKISKILILVIALAAIFGVSYAIFKVSDRGEKTNEISVGNIGLRIVDESSNGITLNNAVPMTDDEGLGQEPYNFTLENIGNYKMGYKLGFELSNDTTMPAAAIKYVLTKDGTSNEPAILGSISPEKVDDKFVYYLDSGVINPSASYSYSLQIWINYNASNEANGTKFSVVARADGEAIADDVDSFPLNNRQALVTPIDTEIDTMLDDDGAYIVANVSENLMIKYIIETTEASGLVVVGANNRIYAYAFIKNNKVGLDIGKWYVTDDNANTWSIYEGNAPIAKSSFNEGNIYNEGYLDKIIESFSW